MRAPLLALALVAACGNSGNSPSDAHNDGKGLDAPATVPELTAFVANPAQVPSGVATMVTWSWTYQQQPTLPIPSCTIDNGVGAVNVGDMKPVTITQPTTFTITCTNSAGSGMRQVVIGVPPAAPVIGTFTASPSLVTTNASTPVTWTWTYSNAPSPLPTCTIEHGVGTVTSGSSTNVTLTQARTYQLTCTNASGTSRASATVSVNECADATHDCQTNAQCTDTPNGFTCACKAGYSGNGDTCSSLQACGATPSLCGTGASCIGGTVCQCNAGYVGDGLTCTKLKWAFVTSTTGTGNLSTWSGATGTGLAAADSVCAARATAGGLTGTYVAWMSDSLNDAYCRVHGFSGKKSANCGQLALPTGAGPWARKDGTAEYPTISKLLAPDRITYAPAAFNESGVEVTSSDYVYTGTDDSGVYTGNDCSDWTSTATLATMGEVDGGGTSWTKRSATDSACTTTGHLRCMEVGTGPALPSRHPAAKKAFLTSVTGTGMLSTWADANGQTGLAAADAVCQARARYAGYANPQNFKAWMASGTSVYSRILTAGPWARPDGIPIASGNANLFSGRFLAPLYQMETNAYAQGNLDAGTVWTGSSQFGGATFNYCNVWTNGTASYVGTIGRYDLLDYRAMDLTTSSCAGVYNLYCFED